MRHLPPERFKDDTAWVNAAVEDLWIYDKLILARKCGYVCGPAGIDVPKPGAYVVRPITNMMGMGEGAEIRHLSVSTDDLPAGYFWCELFTGPHISVDYINGEQVLAVRGDRCVDRILSRWDKWSKVDDHIPYPFEKKFTVLNCEYIDGKLIEAHFRLNPDFQHGDYHTIRPVWTDEWAYEDLDDEPHGTQFIADREGDRLGFLVRPEDR